MDIIFQPVRVDTDSTDVDGLLAFVDQHLVAVLVRLADAAHGELQGKWFLEAGFGACATPKRTCFATPVGARAWILERLREQAAIPRASDYKDDDNTVDRPSTAFYKF